MEFIVCVDSTHSTGHVFIKHVTPPKKMSVLRSSHYPAAVFSLTKLSLNHMTLSNWHNNDFYCKIYHNNIQLCLYPFSKKITLNSLFIYCYFKRRHSVSVSWKTLVFAYKCLWSCIIPQNKPLAFSYLCYDINCIQHWCDLTATRTATTLSVVLKHQIFA